MLSPLKVPISKVIGWITVVQSSKLEGFLFYNLVKPTLSCGYDGQRVKNVWSIAGLTFTRLRLGVGVTNLLYL